MAEQDVRPAHVVLHDEELRGPLASGVRARINSQICSTRSLVSAGIARPLTSSAGPWSHIPVHDVRPTLTSPSSDTLPGSTQSRWHIASIRRSLPAIRSVMLSENSTR